MNQQKFQKDIVADNYCNDDDTDEVDLNDQGDVDYDDCVRDLHCSFNGNSSDLVEPQFKSPGQDGSYNVPGFLSLYHVDCYPAIATRKPAATMGQVMRRKMKRLMYTPTVRMKSTVSRVNGTMIFPITVAAFGHFHLFKRIPCSVFIFINIFQDHLLT